MNKKSGTAGTPVDPIAPTDPHEADKADPGEVEETKAEQIKTKSGKYGSAKVKPFKPEPEAGGGESSSAEGGASSEEKKASWIEIELVGEDDKPIPGEKYRITLPDGTVDEGTLDQNGWVRVEGFVSGQCGISFPGLDAAAWESIESVGAKPRE
jgi:hypothetical protein